MHIYTVIARLPHMTITSICTATTTAYNHHHIQSPPQHKNTTTTTSPSTLGKGVAFKLWTLEPRSQPCPRKSWIAYVHEYAHIATWWWLCFYVVVVIVYIWWWLYVVVVAVHNNIMEVMVIYICVAVML